MDKSEILSHVDHTVLSTTAVTGDIIAACDAAIKFRTASVCIPPCFVKTASEYASGRTKICTVIGFPNGYNTSEIKCAEAQSAISDGADEIDMVINIGALKEKRFDFVLGEIKQLRSVCEGKILKVIIETCLLSDEEKIKMCDIVSRSGADYIKTSTGFAGGGATAHDIKLMAANVAPGLKIKASGGIKSFEDAEMFLNLGADRLGTSRLVKELI